VTQEVAPDSLRRALAEVFARPQYEWVEAPSLRSWLVDRFRDVQSWMNGLEQSNPTLFKLFLLAMVLLLAALLAHIGYVLWRVLRRVPEPADAAVVPGPVIWDADAHLAHADALAAAGRWAEALGHRFLSLVLELDERRAVRFHPSKTPAEYVGEAALDAPGRQSFMDVVGRLYRHVFGATPCDAACYRAFGDAARLVVQHARPH
jgi:hypothetical protein